MKPHSDVEAARLKEATPAVQRSVIDLAAHVTSLIAAYRAQQKRLASVSSPIDFTDPPNELIEPVCELSGELDRIINQVCWLEIQIKQQDDHLEL